MNFILQPGRWYGSGGTESFTRDFSKFLISKGHKVYIIADRLKNDYFDDEDLFFGKIKIRYIKRLKHNKSIVYFIKKNYYLAKKTFQICRKNNINYIFTPDKFVLINWILKLFFKYKIILRTGGITAIVLNKELDLLKKNNIFKRNFLNIYQKISYKLPDKIISISDFEKEIILNKFTKRKDIKVIYHGINTNFYKLDKKLKHKDIVVGFFGRFAPINNPILFLNILSKINKVKKCKGLWIGEVYDYNKKQVNKIIKKYPNIDFKLIGPFFDKELILRIKDIDIFLFTGNLIGIGRSIIEAASCELPIIAINKATLPIGFFTQNDNSAVKQAIKLIKSRKLREKEGVQNRKYVIKNFSLDKQYKKILKFIKS